MRCNLNFLSRKKMHILLFYLLSEQNAIFCLPLINLSLFLSLSLSFSLTCTQIHLWPDTDFYHWTYSRFQSWMLSSCQIIYISSDIIPALKKHCRETHKIISVNLVALFEEYFLKPRSESEYAMSDKWYGLCR